MDGHSSFGWLLAAFAAAWLSIAVYGLVSEFRRQRRGRPIFVAMGMLILLGSGGFFAAALSAVGMLNLPKSFEWPPGYVNGVVETPDSKYLVPLMPSGRVQIYDAQWRFVRGWNVNAEGGDLKVRYTPSRTIEVLTARGTHRYEFTDDGDLITVGTFDESFDSIPRGESVAVPTSPVLWVFSSPFLCMGLVAVGGAGLAALQRLSAHRTGEHSTSCND